MVPEPPRGIRLPNGHRVGIRPVGTTRNGLLDVPDDIELAGWWSGGSRLGDPFGSTLVAAHVDSRTQGLGPFASLLGVRAGDRVYVWSDGLRQAFEVTSLRLRPQGTIGPGSYLHSPDGPPPPHAGHLRGTVRRGARRLPEPRRHHRDAARQGPEAAVTRGLKALAAVAVVVALVVFGFRALTRRRRQGACRRAVVEADRPRRTSAAGGRPLRGHVRAQLRPADGTVEVQTWLRAAAPISELRMTTTDPDLLPGSVESLDLTVHDVDGTLLAHRDSVGTNPQRIRLRASATDLYFSYTVDGAMDDASQTVQNRTLARVLGMDVDYDGAGGVVRRLVTSSGTVMNVACIRATQDFDESPRPCGKPTGDGDWVVDLRGDDWHDRLLAQLEG